MSRLFILLHYSSLVLWVFSPVRVSKGFHSPGMTFSEQADHNLSSAFLTMNSKV